LYEIALIGAGNLGRRHFEGLLKLPVEKFIRVVDPSPTSLEEARQLASLAGDGAGNSQTTFHTSIADLPEKLDYVVIATSSNVRLDVMSQLLNGRIVSSMLLEKVLFQHTTDYAVAAALIAETGTKVWVNTARRAMDIHRSIRKHFAGETISHFNVYGGEWGLGCNGIHFIDFLSFLVGSTNLTVCTSDLDKITTASKRVGYSEFTGTLRGRIDATELALNATRGSSAPILLTIRSENKSCILDESSGHAFLHDRTTDPVWREIRFTLPFISSLSTTIAESILTTGRSDLPDLATSSALHVPIVDALAEFSAKYCGGTPGFAPIT